MQRTNELEIEIKKTDELLANILPAGIVRELKQKGFVSPRLFEHITILFSNFHDFSGIIQRMDPGKRKK